MNDNYRPFVYNRLKNDSCFITPIHSVPPKKKFDFKSVKKNACTSLNDVECFLNNFTHTLKYIKLINLLKKNNK